MSTSVSKPSDFTPEEAIVELRRNAAGEPIRVKIRAVPFSRITAMFGGLPSAASNNDNSDANLAAEERKKREAESVERFNSMMREACVEPRVSFGPDDDVPGVTVRWDDLDKATQELWRDAIMVHSGFKLTEEADAVLSFRFVERGGVAVGG